MDLGELRKTVLALLEDHRVDVAWDHIHSEGHEVTDEEVQATLARGTFDLHESVDGRYVAVYLAKGLPLAIVVVFELRELGGDRRIQVLTAYHAHRERGGGW